MTKFEFLGDLSRLIADLPQEEVEQAMEYYEDYFADAGPEKEQEIIRDFISPAYIAEQLREASLERQRIAAQSSMQEEERQANAAKAAATAGKPAVFSRKQAAKIQKQASAAPTQQPTAQPTVNQAQVQPQVAVQAPSQPQPQFSGQAATPYQATAPTQQGNTVPPTPVAAANVPNQGTAPVPPTQATGVPHQGAAPVPPTQAAGIPTQGAAPVAPTQQATGMPHQGASPVPPTQAAGVPNQAATSPVPPTAAGVPNQGAVSPEKKSSNMRNSIFRDDDEDKEKAAAELAMRNKTKVDIKSINASTSKVDKKQAKANAAQERAYNAEMYSSSKKMVIGVVLLITCPIWLAIVAVILGLFVVGAGAVVGTIVFGVISFAASIASLLLSVLSLLSAQIGTFVFALGLVCLLFAVGVGLWFLSYKLVTRILPGGYFNAKVLFTAVKAKLSRLALK